MPEEIPEEMHLGNFKSILAVGFVAFIAVATFITSYFAQQKSSRKAQTVIRTRAATTQATPNIAILLGGYARGSYTYGTYNCSVSQDQNQGPFDQTYWSSPNPPLYGPGYLRRYYGITTGEYFNRVFFANTKAHFDPVPGQNAPVEDFDSIKKRVSDLSGGGLQITGKVFSVSNNSQYDSQYDEAGVAYKVIPIPANPNGAVTRYYCHDNFGSAVKSYAEKVATAFATDPAQVPAFNPSDYDFVIAVVPQRVQVATSGCATAYSAGDPGYASWWVDGCSRSPSGSIFTGAGSNIRAGDASLSWAVSRWRVNTSGVGIMTEDTTASVQAAVKLICRKFYGSDTCTGAPPPTSTPTPPVNPPSIPTPPLSAGSGGIGSACLNSDGIPDSRLCGGTTFCSYVTHTCKDQTRVYGAVFVNDQYITCAQQQTAQIGISWSNTSPWKLQCVGNWAILIAAGGGEGTLGFRAGNIQLYWYQTPYPGYAVSWTCSSKDRYTGQVYTDQCPAASGSGDLFTFWGGSLPNGIQNYRPSADIILNYYLSNVGGAGGGNIVINTPIPTRTPTPTIRPTRTPTPGSSTLRSVQLAPIADAYVYGSSSTLSTNYGSSSRLRTRGSPAAISYLKFNSSGVNLSGKTITKVQLKIKLYNVSDAASSVKQNIYTASSSWTESNINYNKLHSVSTFITSFGPPTGTPGVTTYTIDVTTDQLKNYLKSGSTFTLAIKSASSSSADSFYFYSRNAGTTSNRPQLIVEYK